jgi:alanine racemase
MDPIRYAKQIKRSLWPYTPSVEILISQKNLPHNLHQFQQRYPNLQFAPVLKSNAYGHGLSLIASVLDKETIAFFAVDSLFEAKVLRNDGIRSPILVIGFVTPENIAQNTVKDVAFTLTSLEQVEMVAKICTKKTKIHLKVDTGLSRQGLMPEQLEAAIALIQQARHLELEGLCSHFADADNPDARLSEQQIRVWQSVVWQVKQAFPLIKYLHMAASAGTTLSHTFENNVGRLGIGLYGYNRSVFHDLNLKPALTMRSVVGSVKTVPAGSLIGYGGTYKAKKPMKLATIPVGYYEGIDRRLSNKGFVQINGQACPIVGRVSMNITTVDVSAIPEIQLGDPVTIISDNPDDPNSIESMAETAATISHEILIHLPQSLRRELTS